MDTEDHVLVTMLEERALTGHATRLRASIEHVRTTMEPVYEAVRHSAPIEVTVRARGIRRDLAVFETAVHAHLSVERSELAELESTLSSAERNELAAQLEAAWDAAIPKPHPPHHGVARRWARLIAQLDRPDSAAEYQPARARPTTVGKVRHLWPPSVVRVRRRGDGPAAVF